MDKQYANICHWDGLCVLSVTYLPYRQHIVNSFPFKNGIVFCVDYVIITIPFCVCFVQTFE